MLISHNLNLIFIHVHRTGGTTIGNLIKSHLASHSYKSLPQHENAKTSASYLLDEYNDYYIFGFTRNPWERILSWYSLINKNSPKSIKEERKRFETFIESNAASDFTTPHFHYNSIEYLTNEKGELKVSNIFRYENFDNAVLELQNKFNLPSLETSILNNTHCKNYHEYYTKKSQLLIAEKCKLDIEYFNYSF